MICIMKVGWTVTTGPPIAVSLSAGYCWSTRLFFHEGVYCEDLFCFNKRMPAENPPARGRRALAEPGTIAADAQGNVTLTVNGKTCNLNLVTHHVSNCH